ncbi:FixH family protein [Thiohalophilus sp.]|uniref:FixH family protein n=1 Tax=Thiohalophilus sp. TaxID=3028392 RepID=UPI002ACEDE84|nr:FixH family protein [Thiohalophilus sp.]MDZ7803563.1 FixH family protein [Thiohalophilus sp.]
MQQITANDMSSPWYRQFWPWFLIALPASAVIASIATVIIAINNPDGLVVDDYYKEGLAINRTLARDRHARFLGLHAEGGIGPEGQVQLVLQGKQPQAAQRLRLSLLHPTRADQDQVIGLELSGASQTRFRGEFESVPDVGHWHVLLEPEGGQWRLTGRLVWPGDGRLRLEPVGGRGEQTQ